jgi:hypothetical protein
MVGPKITGYALELGSSICSESPTSEQKTSWHKVKFYASEEKKI